MVARTCLAAVFFLASTVALAGGAGSVHTATGTIEKADKEMLIVQPRAAGGQFEKKLTLKITGTSKLTVVSQEKRAGKVVAVQRDVDAASLEAGQHIAVIYSAGPESVLLAGVIEKAK